MIVDYERAWLALKRDIVEKKSHGQRDLLRRMAEIEIDCELEGNDFDPTPHTNNGTSAGRTSRVGFGHDTPSDPLTVEGGSYGNSNPTHIRTG